MANSARFTLDCMLSNSQIYFVYVFRKSSSNMVNKVSSASLVSQLLIVTVLVTSLFLSFAECRSLHDKRTDDLPESFNDVKHLNNYLGDLADYYLVLGRPRLVLFSS